jgi:Predicted signal-transduction protein containing cAMP-binding and CBS domains
MIGKYVKTDVIKAYPTTPIREVARLMSQHKVGLVVLVDPKDPYKIVGIVSERDIVKAVAYDVPLDAAVDTIATKNVITLDYNEPVARAAEIFKKYGIRHVVATKDGKLYGVLSIRDLIREEAVLREIAEYYEWTFEPGMSA